ncbi:DELTA-alicitoxin-Pse2b-like [Oculina patagonica]
MLAHLVFICLTLLSTSTGAPAAKDIELGKAIDLRGTDLLSDFQERERTIYEPFPQECLIDETDKIKSSRKFMEYYANSNAFYSSLATQSELDVSLQSSYTLGVSLKVATKDISEKTNKVSGMSLNAIAITEKILVRRGCLEGAKAKFTEEFLGDLKGLPVKVKAPWKSNSWEAYHNFLKIYGSHVISSVTLGTSFRQMTFAESSKSYSERDFEVKACVSVSGPTSVGEVGLDACASVTKEEREEASKIDTSDKVFVLGGNPKTRNKLLDQTRTVEDIQQLLNEASEAPSSIEHTFVAIWNVLQGRFPVGSDNHKRALNLEYYYLGFLNFGCPYVAGGGVAIQKFDYSSSSSEDFPEFECSVAKKGCHTNDDCHYKPIWCSCHGPSCVRYSTETHENGEKKVTAHANSDDGWGWYGCGWKVAGSYCNCYNSDRDQRQVTWSRPSKDCAAHKAPNHGGHRGAKDRGHGKPKGKEGRD